jgi:hypothetical protein
VSLPWRGIGAYTRRAQKLKTWDDEGKEERKEAKTGLERRGGFIAVKSDAESVTRK